MARPLKTGLDYFPLDVDIDQDDKVAIIEAKYGMEGFGVIIKLLMTIYKNGYFYEWTEMQQLLFSRRVNVDINLVNDIINDSVKWGLFDKNMLVTQKILTSRGIQARYLEIVKRRKRVDMVKSYLLLDANIVNVYTNLVIVNINSQGHIVNEDISTQSKVKESKVKESKGKERKEEREEEKSSPARDSDIILNKENYIPKSDETATSYLHNYWNGTMEEKYARWWSKKGDYGYRIKQLGPDEVKTFIERFNNQVVLDNIPFDERKLFARLNNYAMTWLNNNEKKKTEGFINNSNSVPPPKYF